MRAPDISYLTDIHIGCGVVAVVPDLAAHLQMRRPLIVTDAQLLRLGMVDKLALPEGVAFQDTETNPSEANLYEGVRAYRASGCDGIVGLGGGASLDLAKLIGLCVTHPPPVEQYAILRGGSTRITADLPPLIAVPTTAGSGSEVGRAALLRLSSGRKLGFLSPRLLPRAAVCDPALTTTLPPVLTASTGMDAISHCVEAVCSTRVNPVAQAIALDGLRRGWHAIRTAFADGADLAAREQMMLCALMGGLAFQKGLGAVHSLSHPLGALPGLNLHHGTLNALFLAPVLRFNAPACPDAMDALAGAMGLDNDVDVAAAFAALVADLGLPSRLRDLHVPRDAIAELAPYAAEDHCSATNPHAFYTVAAQQLYEDT